MGADGAARAPRRPASARLVLALGLGLTLIPGAGRARTVAVVAPRGEGPGADAPAAELGLGIDRALAAHPRFRRLGEVAILPGELLTAFGCLRFDASCARRAGEAAGAELVLMATVRRDDRGLDVRLALIDVRSGASRRRLARRVAPVGPGPSDEALGAVLQALPAAFLAPTPPHPAGAELVVAAPAGAEVRLDGAALPAGRLVSVPPGEARLAVRLPDGRRRGGPVAVRPGEVRLVLADRLPPVARDEPEASPRRMGAWLALGAGVATGAAAAYMGIQLAREQEDYERARTALALREHRAQGEKFATAANVLLVTSAAALGVSIWLFLE